jgi:catechol 2,3-dioxygenase-like lactoylglutathione lyase family enzyme
MRTYLQAKAMAKSLRELLAGKNVSLSHSECLEIVAQQFGFGNWNVLAAKIDLETAAREPRAEPSISLNQVIPVLRVDSREAARAFYADVLGFQFDWGDEAGAKHGFYAQISRNDLQLHLTTRQPAAGGRRCLLPHAGPRCAVSRSARAKLDAARPLAIHDTFYDARELELEDPFGNRLRFVEINPPGVSAQ